MARNRSRPSRAHWRFVPDAAQHRSLAGIRCQFARTGTEATRSVHGSTHSAAATGHDLGTFFFSSAHVLNESVTSTARRAERRIRSVNRGLQEEWRVTQYPRQATSLTKIALIGVTALDFFIAGAEC